MEDAVTLILPLLAAILGSALLLVGGGRVLRALTRRQDARKADELIAANKAHWCTDDGTPDGTPMDRPDQQKIARAGERRWQQTLRGQRLARKPQGTATRNRKIADKKTPVDGIVKDRPDRPWLSKSVN